MAWLNPSFRWKYMPPLALVAAMALLTAGVVMAFYEDQAFRTRTAQETTAQAQILAATVTAALAFGNADDANEYVAALSSNPAVEAVGVYDARGNKFAGYHRTDANPAPESVTGTSTPVFSIDRLMVAVPVVQNGTRLGTVYLRVMTESLDRRLLRYGAIMLLATMAALVLAVLGTAHRALTRANASLEAHARDLAETNVRLKAEMEERGKAEDQLRQSQKMEAIGQLSGGIAHDFNNLLTIIKGNLQLLERRVQQGSMDVKRYIDPALEGLARAANLTQRILAFSRRQPLTPRPVNLSDLIANMGDLLKHSVGETINIDTSLAADWWTQCDVNQMENVILNLAINARDAMPVGGDLVIATSDIHLDPSHTAEGIPAGDYVRLSITDTGYGMPEDVRARAIDPFFTTKPPGQGTGLGLSMTFGYVRQSNGHLNIDSAVGRGTTVTILMPRYEGQVAMPEAEDGVREHG